MMPSNSSKLAKSSPHVAIVNSLPQTLFSDKIFEKLQRDTTLEIVATDTEGKMSGWNAINKPASATEEKKDRKSMTEKERMSEWWKGERRESGSRGRKRDSHVHFEDEQEISNGEHVGGQDGEVKMEGEGEIKVPETPPRALDVTPKKKDTPIPVSMSRTTVSPQKETPGYDVPPFTQSSPLAQKGELVEDTAARKEGSAKRKLEVGDGCGRKEKKRKLHKLLGLGEGARSNAVSTPIAKGHHQQKTQNSDQDDNVEAEVAKPVMDTEYALSPVINEYTEYEAKTARKQRKREAILRKKQAEEALAKAQNSNSDSPLLEKSRDNATAVAGFQAMLGRWKDQYGDKKGKHGQDILEGSAHADEKLLNQGQSIEGQGLKEKRRKIFSISKSSAKLGLKVTMGRNQTRSKSVRA